MTYVKEKSRESTSYEAGLSPRWTNSKCNSITKMLKIACLILSVCKVTDIIRIQYSNHKLIVITLLFL